MHIITSMTIILDEQRKLKSKLYDMMNIWFITGHKKINLKSKYDLNYCCTYFYFHQIVWCDRSNNCTNITWEAKSMILYKSFWVPNKHRRKGNKKNKNKLFYFQVSTIYIKNSAKEEPKMVPTMLQNRSLVKTNFYNSFIFLCFCQKGLASCIEPFVIITFNNLFSLSKWNDQLLEFYDQTSNLSILWFLCTPCIEQFDLLIIVCLYILPRCLGSLSGTLIIN